MSALECPLPGLSYISLAIGLYVAVIAIFLLLHVVLQITTRVFHLAPGVFCFSFDLFHGSFALGLSVTRPFANLTLCASGDFIDFSFDSILVHVLPPRFCLGEAETWFLESSVNVVLLQSCAPAREQLKHQSDKRQHEQQMNESAERVAAHYPDEPEH
jgi:hypothetical protein